MIQPAPVTKQSCCSSSKSFCSSRSTKKRSCWPAVQWSLEKDLIHLQPGIGTTTHNPLRSSIDVWMDEISKDDRILFCFFFFFFFYQHCTMTNIFNWCIWIKSLDASVVAPEQIRFPLVEAAGFAIQRVHKHLQCASNLQRWELYYIRTILYTHL